MRRPKPSQDSIAAALQAVSAWLPRRMSRKSTEDARRNQAAQTVTGLCPVSDIRTAKVVSSAHVRLPVDEIENRNTKLPRPEENMHLL